MKKIAGWVLIVIGGAYPLVLIAVWALALFVMISTGNIRGWDELIGTIWPLGVAVSAAVLTAGVFLVKTKKTKEEEKYLERAHDDNK